MLPKYNIKLDKGLDEELFLEFFRSKNPLIKQYFPQLKTKDDVCDAINRTYDDEAKSITDTVNFLRRSTDKLDKIAMAISRRLDYSWRGVELINIIPAVCPVCPRWIDERKFMVCYFYYQNSILRIFAHEMTHVLYFKKLSDLTGTKINTEYPSQDWLLSEIIAPAITDDSDTQAIVNDREEPFLLDSKISQEQVKQITTIFNNEQDIVCFRNRALMILGESS